MDDLARARACAAAMYEADTASRALGIEIDIAAVGEASAQMRVSQAMLNGHGLCHGGYLFTLADTAFAFACNAYDNVSVAAAASIEFLRPAHADDRLTATAIERQRGRRTGVYDVDIRNQDGARVALFRGRAFATGAPLLDGESDTE